MLENKRLLLLSTVLWSAITALSFNSAYAQQSTNPLSSSQAAAPESSAPGIGAGAFRYYPSVGLVVGHDSNVFLTESNRHSANYTKLSASLRGETGGERNRFGFGYQGDYVTYSGVSRANHTDHRIGADWYYSPVLRHAFAVDVGYGIGHDQAGTGAREGDLALLNLDLDRYQVSEVAGVYRFGSPGARGRLEVEAGHDRVRYKNNRLFTQDRDRNLTQIAGTFYWGIAAKTSMLFRAEHDKIDYLSTNLDSTEKHYFVGVEFDATAKTTGRILVGRAEKNFDDPTRPDFSGASWRAGVDFKPKTYSKISLSASRDAEETNGFGDFVLRKTIVLDWTHDWTARLRTTLDAGIADETHQPSFRGTEEVTFFGANAEYLLKRWLKAGLQLRTFDRNANAVGFGYERDLVEFSLRADF